MPDATCAACRFTAGTTAAGYMTAHAVIYQRGEGVGVLGRDGKRWPDKGAAAIRCYGSGNRPSRRQEASR